MKATGIRGFNPKLKKAAERLEGLRTPEGEPVPPNTLAELHRDARRSCQGWPSHQTCGMLHPC
jgi:hypothetical protein